MQTTLLFAFAVCFAAIAVTSTAAQDGLNAQKTEQQEQRMKFAIAIHGGAGPSSKQASDEANRARIGSMPCRL